MKKIFVLIAFLVVVTGCATEVIRPTTIQDVMEEKRLGDQVMEEKAEDVMEEKTISNGMSKFKVTAQEGTRDPPNVYARVKNIGNGTGSVRVVARAFKAGQIVSENSVVVEDVFVDEERELNIALDEGIEWVGFTVIVEEP